MSTRNRIQPGDGDPRHGTYNGYSNHRCRCDDCCRANTLFCRRAWDKRAHRGLAPDDPRHGSPSSYGNYGCRCRPCTDAHAADHRARILRCRTEAARVNVT